MLSLATCDAVVRRTLAATLLGLLAVSTPALLLGREPVFVVSVAGVERLLDDVDYLTDLADRPEIAGFVRGMQGTVNNLKGIDKSRSISLVAFLPEGASEGTPPDVALLVPVTSIPDLQKTIGLTKRFTLKEGDVPGDYVFEGPKKKVFVRIAEGWAVVSEKTELLGETSIRSDRWQALLGENDLACHVAWASLPHRIIEEAVDKMTHDRDKERIRRSGEDDIGYEARQLGMDVVLKSGERILRDLETISLTGNVNEKGKRIEAALHFTPKAGTPLADRFVRMQAPTQFAAQTSGEDALLVTMSLNNPEILCRGLSELIEKGKQRADEKLTDEAQRGIVRRLLDVAGDVLGGKNFDGFLRVVPTPQDRMAVVVATRCARDSELAEILGQVLPEAAKSRDVKGLMVDAIVSDGVRIHELVPAETRKEDEELFGTEAAVFLGTGRGVIWGGLGGPGTADILKATVTPVPAAVAAASQAVAVPAEPTPLLSIVVHLKKWAGLIERAGEEPPHVRTAMANVLRESTADEVSLKLQATSSGLSFKFLADDSGLRAILAGMSAEKKE